MVLCYIPPKTQGFFTVEIPPNEEVSTIHIYSIKSWSATI